MLKVDISRESGIKTVLDEDVTAMTPQAEIPEQREEVLQPKKKYKLVVTTT